MNEAHSRTWWALDAVPTAVEAALEREGWTRTAEDEGGLRLLWCGTDWKDGLTRLARSGSEQHRARTVLAGHEPPAGIADRIREQGGLTWLAASCPGWMLELLEGTLDRARRELPVHRLGAVSELEARTDAPIEAFLEGLAEHVADLLDAQAIVLRRPHDRFEPFPLGLAPIAWPAGLPEQACLQPEPVIVPYLPVSRLCSVPEGSELRAAAALCLGTRSAVGEPDVVLALMWTRPFLPTPGEFRLLELLGVVGRLNLRRLRERARLDEAHKGHVAALAAMLPRSAGHDALRTTAHPPETSHEVAAASFVRRILDSHAGHPELLALAIRLSASSRAQPPWLFLAGGDELTPEACERAATTQPRGEPWREPGGQWRVVQDIGPHGSLGTIVASYGTRSAARTATTSLVDLAASLSLGANVLRWSDDSLALAALADEQAREPDPETALTRMIDRIRTRMDADGARLHVVRRTSAGPELQPLRVRTSSPPPPTPANLHEVLRWGEWTRGQDEVHHSQHLCVPVFASGEPAGVLEVWRSSPEPFDDRLDPEALWRFAPHVAAACKRVMHVELLQRRTSEMALLLRQLEPHTPTRVAAELVLSRVAGLSGAAAAVLLRRSAGPTQRAYVESLWCADPALADLLQLAMAELPLETEQLPWTEPLSARLDEQLSVWGLDRMHHRATLSSPTPEGSQPTSAVALLDLRADDASLQPLAPEVQDEAANELFHYAAALLENATRNTARAAAERLARAHSEPAALAQAAREILAELTGAEAVIIALGDRPSLSIRYVWPERTSLIGRGLPSPDDPTALLPDLARTFGWAQVRSAQLEPMVDRGRWLGAMLVLTSSTGPELGWHRRQIVHAVATRMAFEMDKARRHSALEDLNAVAGRLAVHHGEVLGRHLVSELTAWARDHLRSDGRVLVVVRAHGQQTLLVAGDPSDDQAHLRELNLASRRWGQVVVRWGPKEDLEGVTGFGMAGLAVPFVLPDQETLTGHLVVLSHTPFTDDHVPIAREAARELAVVLEGERVRHGFMAAAGVFRHALLSPVQGLTDAALFLAELADKPDAPPDLLKRQRLRILDEAEKVRRWRTIERLYGGGLLGGEIHLRPRRQPLRAFVEHCMSRFEVTLASRNIALLLDWGIRGRDVFPFDRDALDIILSNLLDNAAKYAFFNRHITVGAAEQRDKVQIWVSDVGHPVPETINIYDAGARLDWEDPFRTIHGEGLGLRIARSLAVAHGGHLEHSCRAENAAGGGEQRDETRPFVVRFLVTLPK